MDNNIYRNPAGTMKNARIEESSRYLVLPDLRKGRSRASAGSRLWCRINHL